MIYISDILQLIIAIIISFLALLYTIYPLLKKSSVKKPKNKLGDDYKKLLKLYIIKCYKKNYIYYKKGYLTDNQWHKKQLILIRHYIIYSMSK